MLPLSMVYILVCAVVGVLGRHRLIGFWGFFLLSIVLSPVVTLIALAVTMHSPRKKPAGT